MSYFDALSSTEEQLRARITELEQAILNDTELIRLRALVANGHDVARKLSWFYEEIGRIAEDVRTKPVLDVAPSLYSRLRAAMEAPPPKTEDQSEKISELEAQVEDVRLAAATFAARLQDQEDRRRKVYEDALGKLRAERDELAKVAQKAGVWRDMVFSSIIGQGAQAGSALIKAVDEWRESTKNG